MSARSTPPTSQSTSQPTGVRSRPREVFCIHQYYENHSPTNINIHGYTDDHALKMSFNGASRQDERDTIQALTDTATVVKDWMDLNRLKMNDTKT